MTELQVQVKKVSAKEEIEETKLEEYREAFNQFDTDGDGTVDLKELATVMKSLGQNPTQETLDGFIQEYDSDNNGFLDFSEFCKMMQEKVDKGDDEETMADAFKIFDRNDDGWIAADDIKDVMKRLAGIEMSDRQVSEMIKEADISGEGYIDYDEFVRMLMLVS